MIPNIRVALEKLNHKMHNNIYKIGFEWCEKHKLQGMEKSRFLDGLKLGSYLQAQELGWFNENERPPSATYSQLWMANDLNYYSVIAGRKVYRDGKIVLIAGCRNPTGSNVEIVLDASIYTYWADIPDRPCIDEHLLPKYPYPNK